MSDCGQDTGQRISHILRLVMSFLYHWSFYLSAPFFKEAHRCQAPPPHTHPEQRRHFLARTLSGGTLRFDRWQEIDYHYAAMLLTFSSDLLFCNQPKAAGETSPNQPALPHCSHRARPYEEYKGTRGEGGERSGCCQDSAYQLRTVRVTAVL